MPGGLSTLETSVTGFPSMANSFSFVVGVAVAVSSREVAASRRLEIH